MLSKLFTDFSQKLTFQRQLGITVALGILSLALLSSIVGSWQGEQRARRDLIEQGRRITENLARQSTLALVFSSAENAAEAVNATLTFPGVVGVNIHHADGRQLLSQGKGRPNRSVQQVGQSSGLHASAMFDYEDDDAWVFSAPVYSKPFSESPFSAPSEPELLGRVSVKMSKAALTGLSRDIYITNLTTSFSFALLFLILIRLLTRNMAQPLSQLSDSMARAQRGESQVRAEPGGPKDIAAMAHAFNDMMSVQEKRGADLSHSEEKYRTLVESALSIILRWDTQGHIVYINRYAEKLFGYQPDELIGKHVVGTIVPETESTSRDLSGLMDDILANPRKYQLNINENTRKDGEHLWVMWTNRPIFDDTGKMIEVLSVGNDITERMVAETALKESMHKLQEKEQAKSRFLAAAGHDLRQPLAAANLFIDTLKIASPTPQQSKIIQQLDHAMTTFNGLLDALLNVSKLDAGIIKPEYTSIDIAELFKWLERSFTPLAEEKHLDLRLHYPERDKLTVRSDIGLIKSVLMNLVSNSIKFTASGSILISARRRGNEAIIQVWDTGPGIPDNHVEHIFDEFYQIDNPQRDRTKGLGLGLSIVRRALALMGSNIICHSRMGHGSRFKFSLPLDVDSPVHKANTVIEIPHGESITASFARGKHFVVLDDDKLIAEAMTDLLTRAGAKVTCFHTPEDALQQIEDGNADHYIVDYMLGDKLNGIQFLNQLRQKLGQPINAVLLTGDTSTQFIREAAACVWPVLHKPANMEQLFATLAAQTPA